MSQLSRGPILRRKPRRYKHAEGSDTDWEHTEFLLPYCKHYYKILSMLRAELCALSLPISYIDGLKSVVELTWEKRG